MQLYSCDIGSNSSSFISDMIIVGEIVVISVLRGSGGDVRIFFFMIPFFLSEK